MTLQPFKVALAIGVLAAGFAAFASQATIINSSGKKVSLRIQFQGAPARVVAAKLVDGQMAAAPLKDKGRLDFEDGEVIMLDTKASSRIKFEISVQGETRASGQFIDGAFSADAITLTPDSSRAAGTQLISLGNPGDNPNVLQISPAAK